MRAQYYLGLVGGAAVIVPDGQLLHVCGFLVQRLGLAPESLASPVNPDVERLHPAPSINKFGPIRDEYFDIQPIRDHCLATEIFTRNQVATPYCMHNCI